MSKRPSQLAVTRVLAPLLPLDLRVTERLADTPSDRESALCEALLQYLREHPRAMDSLEGIVEWWLPRYQVRVGVETVTRALNELEARGLVERVGDATHPLYRLRVRAAAN